MDNILKELQDPITLELLDDPVTVPCCTKAFSRSSLASFFETQLEVDHDATCPNCRASLSDFDVHGAPRNVVLASLIDNLRAEQMKPQPQKEHEWSCTLTPIAAAADKEDPNETPIVAELLLSCRKSKFQTRPSLFIAVVDESGSMSGRPMEQVRMALEHMVGLAATNANVNLRIISYSSGAVEISNVSEYGRRSSGTNFQAAFQQIQLVLQQYRPTTEPNDYASNVVSSVAIAFLTDGQDGSSLRRDRLVPELAALLEDAEWLGSENTDAPPPPLTVHTIGFGGGCDSELLESMRLIGSQEGVFRYASPQDDGDTLCNKLSDLFEISSRASSVPITLNIGKSDDAQAIRFSVDSNRNGHYKQWITLSEKVRAPTHIQVDSALDDHISVAVEFKKPSNSVFQRWLSKCTDDLASEILNLSQTGNSDKLKRLHCSILEQRANSILQKAHQEGVHKRIEFMLTQIQAIKAGTTIQLGKLSDLRFASLFANGSRTDQLRATSQIVNIRALPPQEIPQLDMVPAFEHPLRKRYTRNNQGTNRTKLQEAIVNTKVNKLNPELEKLIEGSTLQDVSELVDADGNNAIMLAAYCGHSEILSAIIRKHPGINLELENPQGETAVTLAVKKRGYHHTLAALLEAGANIPRRKAIETFCICNGFVVTAQIIANYGESSLGVDTSMTAEYVRFVYERAIQSNKEWNKVQFLNVALSKQLVDVAVEILERESHRRSTCS